MDRAGRVFLSVRDQNTFDLNLRRKRLMTLMQLFLVHRYKIHSVHYVTPTEDNRLQAEGMKLSLIVSDIEMPGFGTGVDALKKLRACRAMMSCCSTRLAVHILMSR